MGALSTPLLALDGRLGLAGWQWLLLLEGLPALVMAVVLLVALPDAPDKVRWLTPDDKHWLATRLARDAEESGPNHGSLWRALTNPIVIAIGLADAVMFAINNAINFSSAKIIVSLGKSTMAAAGTVVTIAGMLCIVTMLLTGQAADRSSAPFTLKAALAGASALGIALLWAGGATILTPIGYVLFYVSAISSSMMMAVLVSRFVHPSARAAGIAMTNTLAQIGGFVGPLLWGIAADRSGGFTLGLAIAAPLPLIAAIIILFAGVLQQRAATRGGLAAA
jgi:ACS family tartrate transporter-like MFS transporter